MHDARSPTRHPTRVGRRHVLPSRLETVVARTLEIATIVGAGAAGAVAGVLLIGGSLLLIVPVVTVVGVVTVIASGSRQRRTGSVPTGGNRPVRPGT